MVFHVLLRLETQNLQEAWAFLVLLRFGTSKYRQKKNIGFPCTVAFWNLKTPQKHLFPCICVWETQKYLKSTCVPCIVTFWNPDNLTKNVFLRLLSLGTSIIKNKEKKRKTRKHKKKTILAFYVWEPQNIFKVSLHFAFGNLTSKQKKTTTLAFLVFLRLGTSTY